MKIYKKAILPRGFKAAGLAAGIKKSGKLDLALLYSGPLARVSCGFTVNKISAAPVKINKEHLKTNRDFKTVIINSGNANCFTGKPGITDADKTARYLAKALGVKKEAVLLASTGIIGRRLPFAKIKQAIPGLISGLSEKGIDKAKLAILTTDTFAKEITVRFNINGRIVSLCGIAKGAGMIAPDMACFGSRPHATMLAFILTDADISQRALDEALKAALADSFNCITIDGCMSTNDSVILLANGAAGNALIDRGGNFNLFTNALKFACLSLAKMIVRDAEGATKFIQIKVQGAETKAYAKKAALSIANSNLFKTAMYGRNPNFGRIAAAIGASGIEVKEKDLKIKVGPLAKKEIKVEVIAGRGKASAVVYTSDLTPEYIRINAEYN